MKLEGDSLSQDTRFWEVFDKTGASLGLFMYGNIINDYTSPFNRTLSNARIYMKSIGHKMVCVGDIMPLEEDSLIPEIQKKKLHHRKLEKKRNKKYAMKYGFKLTSIVKFGKYKGRTIQQIIDEDYTYWLWFSSRDNIILHPSLQDINPIITQTTEWKISKDVLKSLLLPDEIK